MKAPLVRDLVLGALVWAVLSYAWNFSNLTVPNERTRLYLTVAMVDERTIAVDGPLQRFGHVYDLASFNGRHFTDKAPARASWRCRSTSRNALCTPPRSRSRSMPS